MTRTEAAERLREWSKEVVRSVPAVPIRDTDYVPTFKRRVTACIDRAAVLLALEHAALPDEALAAERRATVERIRARLTTEGWMGHDRILDEEAANAEGTAR